jgi:hypothetical protein
MPKSKMSPEEEQVYLESISFSNLVKAIDEKWSHTYLDVPEQDSFESEEETSC